MLNERHSNSLVPLWTESAYLALLFILRMSYPVSRLCAKWLTCLLDRTSLVIVQVGSHLDSVDRGNEGECNGVIPGWIKHCISIWMLACVERYDRFYDPGRIISVTACNSRLKLALTGYFVRSCAHTPHQMCENVAAQIPVVWNDVITGCIYTAHARAMFFWVSRNLAG